jgi:hypothetical protein
MADNPYGRVYILEMENSTHVYLCPRHLKAWRLNGGKEPAKVATGRECDHCREAGPGSSWRAVDDDS